MKLILVSSVLLAVALLIIATSFIGGGRAVVGEALSVSTEAGRARSPVIVELFTSEGCSSCPPADRVLAQLAQEQSVDGAEVIALSEHVDYWNYIGWADPFSQASFSARQEAYAGVFRREQVYTPQMVVDGQAEFNGSNAARAREAIARLSQAAKAEVRIALVAAPAAKSVTEENSLRLKVEVSQPPAVTAGDVAEVLLAVTENNLASNVVRGENAGHRLAHVSVVRELRALGRIDPAAQAFTGETAVLIPAEWKRADLRAVVLVQERAHRRILGAAQLSLAAK